MAYLATMNSENYVDWGQWLDLNSVSCLFVYYLTIDLHFRRATAFEEFNDYIPIEIVKRFELIYAHVDDVDLFIAGISEQPVAGALLGPTFQVLYSFF